MSPLPILNFSESRKLDQDTIQSGLVSGFELMRRAGQAMAEKIAEICARKHFSKEILILAGKGNNAGDSFMVAKALLALGFFPNVFLTYPKECLKGDALLHFKKMEEAGVLFSESGTGTKIWNFLKTFSGDVVVDGLLGTGFNARSKSVEISEIIEALNASHFWVFALDIPSGMGERGETFCVHADITLTVGAFKQTFLKRENVNLCGRIIPMDIGFPESSKSLNSDARVFVQDDLKKHFKRRPRSAHKGNYGHVLLVGGAYGFSGALVLAGLGALRSGCGLLTLASETKTRNILHASLSEAMTLDLSKLNLKEMEKFDAVGIGPGLGTSARAAQFLSAIVKTGSQPLVLDADVLNLLAMQKIFLKKSERLLVLTPHPGEAARLLECTVSEVESDRFSAARTLQKKQNAWIVLKGAHTVVCGPEGILLHLSGTPAMASGGMGDVLTGMITSFLAQGFSPWDACNVAVALQGLAAEELEWEIGPFGILASEVAKQVPCVMKTFI